MQASEAVAEPLPPAEDPQPRASRAALWAEAGFLVAVTVAGALLAVWALQLWRADLRVPFVYDGDALPMGAFFKGLAQNGTWWTNPSLGVPGGFQAFDSPFIAAWNQVVMRAVLLFVPAYPLGMNVFYLLGYPFTALVAAWALRRLGVGRVPAAVGALLYAVIPYHFARGEGHLFLSEYYFVPLGIVLALECASAFPPFGVRRSEAAGFFGRNPWAAVLACVLLASCDVYYGFFTALFVAIACLYGLARYRGRAHVVSAGVILGVILLATVANLAPALVYRMQHGPNDVGLARNPGQAEVYGLKLDQMFLPVDGHRIPAFARLKALYHEGAQKMGRYMDNEGVIGSPLGIVGGLGLLSLFGWAFVAFARGPSPTGRGDLLSRAGVLAVTGFVVGTVGGLSALIAFVFPQIRAYNRISIFLAFLALTAVAIGLDRVSRDRGVLVGAIVSAAVLAFALFDQVSPAYAPDYAALARQFHADGAFVASVEGALPRGTALLELPYMPYPEPGGPVVEMPEYVHLIPYLHSSGLRISYAAMKGRPVDASIHALSSLPAAEIPAAARKAGYGGVWVDTRGYADKGASIEAGLRSAGLTPLLSSPDGRWVVYRL